jgi:hypothetical protein
LPKITYETKCDALKFWIIKKINFLEEKIPSEQLNKIKTDINLMLLYLENY